MNNDEYKIVHKKPTNYENSTLSNSSSNSNVSNKSEDNITLDSKSNSKSDSKSDSISNLYIGYNTNKNIEFDKIQKINTKNINNTTNNLNKNIDLNSNSDSNLDINSDVIHIYTNIFKLKDNESIKKAIIDYFNIKKYSEQTQNLILLELKKYNIKMSQIKSLNNEDNLSNLDNLTNSDNVVVINDTTEKNKWFIIITIVLVIIILVAFYIKLNDDKD